MAQGIFPKERRFALGTFKMSISLLPWGLEPKENVMFCS
jgi:hypothetical protein